MMCYLTFLQQTYNGNKRTTKINGVSGTILALIVHVVNG
jgi:hypothetical protein